MKKFHKLFIATITYAGIFIYTGQAKDINPPKDVIQDTNLIKSIDLILLGSYNPSKNSTVVDNAFGKLKAKAAAAFDVDIKTFTLEGFDKDIRQTLKESYFKEPNELETFLNTKVENGIKTYLVNKTDINLKSYLKYIGTDIIKNIADRIMETEGVDSKKKRDLWNKKILDPFVACIDVSKTPLNEGLNCISTLTTNLVPNIVLAITYEKLNFKLASKLELPGERDKFIFKHLGKYKDCFLRIGLGGDSGQGAKTCAIESISKGIEEVANIGLDLELKDKNLRPEDILTVKKSVTPNLRACLKKVPELTQKKPEEKIDYEKEFLSCIDKLAIDTVPHVITNNITTNKSVMKLFDDIHTKQNGNIHEFSKQMVESFRNCAKELVNKGIKDESGSIDFNKCIFSVTNAVTYAVAVHSFNNASLSNLLPPKEDTKKLKPTEIDNLKEQAKAISERATLDLKKCWKPDQDETKMETCLKNSITLISKLIGDAKLQAGVPSDVKNRGELIKSELSKLEKCVSKILDDVTVTKVDNIEELFTPCSNEVSLSAANLASNDLLKSSFYSNLEEIKTKEKLEKLPLSEDELQRAINSLLSKNSTCIFGHKSQAKTPVLDHANECIKSTIVNMANFIGKIKLKVKVGDLYTEHPKEFQIHSNRLGEVLKGCLNEKEGTKYKIQDMLDHIPLCSEKTTKELTKNIAPEALNYSSQTYIHSNEANRKTIVSNIEKDFNSCINVPNSKADYCALKLKIDATTKIVPVVADEESKKQLSASSIPEELISHITVFNMCIETLSQSINKFSKELNKYTDEVDKQKNNELDLCIIDFMSNFAQGLGKLKFDYLLKTSLGSEYYDKNSDAIIKAKNNFSLCLNELKNGPAKNASEKLTLCIRGLTQSGFAIVRKYTRTMMSGASDSEKNEKEDAAKKNLKDLYAITIPCLAPFIPPSPFNPELMHKQIDSNLRPVAVLLAQYIEEQTKNSEITLNKILEILQKDLENKENLKGAKRDVVEFMKQHNVLDNFLQLAVFATIKEALSKLSKEEIPESIRNLLLDKKNLEEVFSSNRGKQVINSLLKDVVEPFLLHDQKIDTITAKKNIIKLLIESDQLGRKIVDLGVQDKMNDLNFIKSFFAKRFYGNDALSWEKVGKTPKGKIAHAYISEYILAPAFNGETIDQKEKEKREEKASELVTEAVKDYGNN